MLENSVFNRLIRPSRDSVGYCILNISQAEGKIFMSPHGCTGSYRHIYLLGNKGRPRPQGGRATVKHVVFGDNVGGL